MYHEYYDNRITHLPSSIMIEVYMANCCYKLKISKRLDNSESGQLAKNFCEYCSQTVKQIATKPDFHQCK